MGNLLSVAVWEVRGKSSAAAVDLASLRSARVQEDLKRDWREKVRRQPPAMRERFLASADGRSALGAQTCHQLLKALRRRFDELHGRLGAPALVEEWVLTGDLPTGLEFDNRGRLSDVRVEVRTAADGKKLIVREPVSRERLRAGKALVRNGTAGEPLPGEEPTAEVGARRWTPRSSAVEEDVIDGMSAAEAAREAMGWPSSPSAHVIEMVGIRRGKEIRPKGKGRQGA